MMKTAQVSVLVLSLAAATSAGSAFAPQTPLAGVKVGRVARARIQITVVPSLAGMSRNRADAALEKAHLRIGTISNAQSDKPAGTVISQNPGPDRSVPWGSPVDVGFAVPIDVQRIPVPNFVGRTAEQAQLLLQRSGLTGGRLSTEASSQPEGEVIGQNIPPQTLVPIRTPIDLILAKAKTVLVPDLVGKPLQEAQQIVEKTELGIRSTTSQVSEGTAGEVLGQDIAPDTEVPVGTLIALTVSQLPELLEVPNVAGMPREDAIKLLESEGFVAGAISEQGSSVSGGQVLGQSPAAGSRLPPNSTIALKVAIPLFTVPSVIGMNRADGRELLTQTGFALGSVSSRLSLFTPGGEILEQSPAAGNQFATAQQPVALVVAVNLPPWIPLPLILLSAGSIGMLVVRPKIPKLPKSAPVTMIRSKIELDSGKSEIRSGQQPGRSFDVRVRSRVDQGIQAIRTRD